MLVERFAKGKGGVGVKSWKEKHSLLMDEK